MKKVTILFIQGGGKGAYEMDHALVSYLERALGDGYNIVYPAMPGENDPQYQPWKAAIEKQLQTVSGNIMLIGHSIGSFLLFKYVFGGNVPENVIGAFFISTPFIGDQGWTFENMALPDASFLKRLSFPIFFYHSTDDKTVPFSHLALYEKRLPRASIRIIACRGHQFNNDLSEVMDDIKHLMRD